MTSDISPKKILQPPPGFEPVLSHPQPPMNLDELPVVKPEHIHGEYIGYCKWFNSKLGYGFIRICEGSYKGVDIFVHHSGIRPLNSSFKTLYQGEYVNVNIIDGRNGKQAIDVSGVLGGPLLCDHYSTPRSFRPYHTSSHHYPSYHNHHTGQPLYRTTKSTGLTTHLPTPQ